MLSFINPHWWQGSCKVKNIYLFVHVPIKEQWRFAIFNSSENVWSTIQRKHRHKVVILETTVLSMAYQNTSAVQSDNESISTDYRKTEHLSFQPLSVTEQAGFGNVGRLSEIPGLRIFIL